MRHDKDETFKTNLRSTHLARNIFITCLCRECCETQTAALIYTTVSNNSQHYHQPHHRRAGGTADSAGLKQNQSEAQGEITSRQKTLLY